MRKVWIEAALNGGWSRALQSGIPDTLKAIWPDYPAQPAFLRLSIMWACSCGRNQGGRS